VPKPKAPVLTNERKDGPASYNLNLRVAYKQLQALRREYAAKDGDLGWQEWLRARVMKGL